MRNIILDGRKKRGRRFVFGGGGSVGVGSVSKPAQVEPSILLLNGGVLRVGERARGTVAQSGDVVLIPAKGLRARLCFVRAKALVDHLRKAKEDAV
eukprot:5791929-Pleurochrysis_carterae.AAC.2